MFSALLRLDHRFADKLFNEIKAHVGNRCRPVKTALFFHLQDDVINHLLFILLELQRFQDPFVSLNHLGRGKTDRYLRALRMILNQVHDCVQRSVYSAAVFLRVTEILPSGSLLIFRHMDRMPYQLVDTLVLARRNRNNRYTEHFLHPVDQNGAAVSLHFIHHIQSDNHRHIQLHQLHREIEVALDIRRVHDIDNAGRLFFEYELSGNQLFLRIGRHRINPRKVCHFRAGMSFDGAALPVYRNAREISYMLVGAGQLIEQGCFAGILVSGKREGQLGAVRKRVLALLHMIPAVFAKARMFAGSCVGQLRSCAFRNLLPFCRPALACLRFPDLYFCRVVQTKRQLITMNQKLHGVSHGSVLDEGHTGAGNYTHVQKVLPEFSFSTYFFDNRALSDFQFSQCHFGLFHYVFHCAFYCLFAQTSIAYVAYSATGVYSSWFKKAAAENAPPRLPNRIYFFLKCCTK